MFIEWSEDDMKGVRITHKNGFVDNYDPVVTLKTLNGLFVVDNTYNTYKTPMSQVSRVESYDRILKVDEDFEDITWYEDINFETIWEL